MAHAAFTLFVKLVVPLFFIGMVGSALVVVIAAARDLYEVTRKDAASPSYPAGSTRVDAGETHS